MKAPDKKTGASSPKRRRPRLCPVCGDQISISGKTSDGRAIGSCGDAFPPGSRTERKTAGITPEEGSPVIHEAVSAGLVQCAHCDAGFRRVGGVHVGSQRLGMILNTPCERVFATHLGNATESNTRPWMAYVDGEPLRRASSDARRFASSTAAYRASCASAPRRWHP